MERMSPTFALFNYHVNGAKDKAREVFIQRFGEEAWTLFLQPFVEVGIMAILKYPPSEYTRFYVDAVTAYANGDTFDAFGWTDTAGERALACVNACAGIADPSVIPDMLALVADVAKLQSDDTFSMYDDLYDLAVRASAIRSTGGIR